jgi:3-hydroxyisobutyrate dehydrogenase
LAVGFGRRSPEQHTVTGQPIAGLNSEIDMRVGFIGLGNMGRPQAEEIARGGFDLTVYDSWSKSIDAFKDKATLAGSPAEVARASEIIGICVRDDQQVRQVMEARDGVLAGIAPGALVLVHSTVSPATIIALAEATAARGAELVDAAVTRTKFGVAQGPFVLSMTGGDPTLTERARPVLQTYSTQVVHAGPLGAGMALKITNNFVTWVHILTMNQALALAKAGQVDVAKLREVMAGNGNLTPVTKAVLDNLVADASGMSPERRAFFESQGKIGEKDLALAADFARAGGVQLSLALHAGENILKSMTSG